MFDLGFIPAIIPVLNKGLSISNSFSFINEVGNPTKRVFDAIINWSSLKISAISTDMIFLPNWLISKLTSASNSIKTKSETGNVWILDLFKSTEIEFESSLSPTTFWEVTSKSALRLSSTS